ncbi:CocE/NonD family hydrolase [Streptomyces lutosisoli]|uniref:CocE/NonD family hydrolase n=1 Tax=Streptomyces lutosisoli TaxID=2665721 RepID=A0ABW2W0Y7_9ACTN
MAPAAGRGYGLPPARRRTPDAGAAVRRRAGRGVHLRPHGPGADHRRRAPHGRRAPEHRRVPSRAARPGAAVEAREDVLVFTTELLTEDVEVTGRVRAVLFAATDGPSTDWVARLCDVDEMGVSRNVADGIVRVRAAKPGEAAEHVVDLWSTSVVFRAGHRIRVQVTSSNFPRWDRNLNTGEPEESATTARVARQQVFHDPARPSRIVLPVVPVPAPPTVGRPWPPAPGRPGTAAGHAGDTEPYGTPLLTSPR